MKLIVLGSQSPLASKGHNCPGFLVESSNATILLDCGSGTHSMVKFPEVFHDLHIFISHLHIDHFSDVFIYQLNAYVYQCLGKISKPINIYMPKTPENDANYIASQQFKYAEYKTIAPDTEFKIGDAIISFCPTAHPIETYAIKVREGNKAVVYTADTSFDAHDKLVSFAKGVDLLISESSLLVEHNSPTIKTHLTAEQAGIIAKDSEAKQLMLTHFWHEESVDKYINEARQVFKNVIPAVEGRELNF